jgi:hypothetical protein
MVIPQYGRAVPAFNPTTNTPAPDRQVALNRSDGQFQRHPVSEQVQAQSDEEIR